ncbi:MAG: chromosome segregation protein SMC [Oscillospiraceae bacterium]|jgi:chromosome segregation protein
MHLKALELQGFKSFPGKTVLNFADGITAVVGPNGSGKSNIADALRWVMGEQSTKELRGGKMEDVIFGGTAQRPQLGFAEVTLTIDNSDGLLPLEENEVMVTRRYYRSGESEFYINKRSVRLRDITELFMDTGLGKEGYSVIGQGKIDEIISEKNGGRREVFESAAGIARYRRRKEEAERKIESTDANLLRISDKIDELELQVGPLKEQAENAKKYLLLRDELRALEVSLWLETLDKLRSGALKLRSDFENAQREKDEAGQALEKLYKDAEAGAEAVREHDIEAESERAKLNQAEAEEAELQSAAAVLRTNIENNSENLRLAEAERERGAASEESLKAQIEERRSRAAEIEKEREELRNRASELIALCEKAAEETGDIDRETEALRSRLLVENMHREQAGLRLSALRASAEELKLSSGDLEAEIKTAREQAEKASQAEAETEKELETAKNRQVSLQNIINGYQLRRTAREKSQAAAEEHFLKSRQELRDLQSRVGLLSDMEREYEGFSKSVRTVMQESGRGKLRGVHGPLGSLVRTGREYTLAIEVALGPALQNIVVDSEENAKAAISMLKRLDAGRATFLPLTTIRGRKLSEDVRSEPGCLGLASEIVEYDNKYEDIIGNFLGRTVVTDNIDNAIRMAKKFSYRFRIVTLDGQLINPGGSMTGGSAGRNVGILSRAEELSRLRASLEAAEKRVKAAENEYLEAKRQLEAAVFEMGTAETEKREQDDEVLRLTAQARHLSELSAAAEAELNSLMNRGGGLAGRLAEIDEQIKAAENEAEEHKKEADRLDAQIAERLRGRADAAEKSGRLSAEIADITAKDAALLAEKSSAEQSLRELGALLEEMRRSAQERETLAGERRQRDMEMRAELSFLEERIKRAGENCEALRASVREMGERRLLLEAERSRRDREIQECQRRLIDLERECARLEQKVNAADAEEKQILEKLWDTYELNYSTAAPVRIELESITKAKSAVSDLKRKMSALGTPNLGAIDEYARVSERYEYLTAQRDDVLKAKAELTRIISEITGRMREIFTDQFKLINRYFDETFREIFGGGHAGIEMEEGADILQCDIDIRVQPPGKSLKTISLLSGGEKAFAAIALYFAILKVRPTPFCVIDEIDAALDAANVELFGDYLRKMSDKTQFIAITHRRGTMERANMLYGVTMQEKGVSKVLALNLAEAEKEYVTA